MIRARGLQYSVFDIYHQLGTYNWLQLWKAQIYAHTKMTVRWLEI